MTTAHPVARPPRPCSTHAFTRSITSSHSHFDVREHRVGLIGEPRVADEPDRLAPLTALTESPVPIGVMEKAAIIARSLPSSGADGAPRAHLATLGAVAYDEELADRIRELLAAGARVTEKRMFGGLAFLVDGKLAVSASGQGGLLARIDPAQTDRLVRGEHVEAFVMRGRPMDGWLHVDPDARAHHPPARAPGSTRCVTYARSLPPKR